MADGKETRINLKLTPENHTFVKAMARACGMNMTEYLNELIGKCREESVKYAEIKANRAELKS